MVEIASDTGASGKKVDLGEKEDYEQDLTQAVLVLEQIQRKEKISIDEKKVELIVEKLGENKVS